MLHTAESSRRGLVRALAFAAAGVGACVGLGFTKATTEPGEAAKNTKAGPGVAVVELFTSEGCSSCPVADKALAALHARTSKAGQPVYTLAFHVDYWNNLGWPDRFSTAAYTQRQHEYARAFGSGSVYTPQAIVNGKAEFVGSESGRLDTEVSKAVATPAPASVKITQEPWDAGGALKINAAVSNAPAGSVLCAALCEDGLVTDVKRGENGGRKLEHEGVVRDFVTSPMSGDGNVSVNLTPPKDLNSAKASIVLYVQDAKTMKVLGANAAALQAGKAPVKLGEKPVGAK
ncbi:MAG: DUF1223 domain-containing protein [Phycisphaerales bacterium]|jgi:hypothetical protein